VGTFGVIKTEVVTDPDLGISSILIRFNIHLLIFHCTPQLLYEQVVAIPPFSEALDITSVILRPDQFDYHLNMFPGSYQFFFPCL